jgi:Asp-tRNA(Asn)/Glu-tRNA(Gln) amidotransferase A subunit family amidase
MTASKKWYSLFVVTDDKDSVDATATSAAAPQRAGDLVPELDTAPAPSVTAGPPPDLDVVYQSAKIAAPAHGYTVLKVAEMLQSEHLKALPADVKSRSIMVALDAAGVKVAEIVEDAVRRDRALDTYERVLQKHVDEARAGLEAENKQLEAEIAQRVAELRARIDENGKKAAADQAELAVWRTRKHQEEETIADTVSYFVSENPITTTRRASTDPVKGDTDVR